MNQCLLFGGRDIDPCGIGETALPLAWLWFLSSQQLKKKSTPKNYFSHLASIGGAILVDKSESEVGEAHTCLCAGV